MNQYTDDYNFLIKLMPEIEMWQILTNFMDINTLTNFLLAFPVINLHCTYYDNYARDLFLLYSKRW